MEIGGLLSGGGEGKLGSNTNALLDLLGGDDPADGLGLVPPSNSIIPTGTTNGTKTSSNSNNTQDLLDLLGGLDMPVSTPPAAIPPLGGGVGLDLNCLNDNSIKATATTTGTVTGSSSFGGLDNLLNSNLTSPTTGVIPSVGGIVSPTTLGTAPIIGSAANNSLFSDFSSINNNEEHTKTLTALDKNGLLVQLLAKNSGGCLQIVMTAVNNSLSTLEQYLFQAAVPRSFSLQMLSPSGSALPPGGTITQEMRISSTAKATLRMRLRISYQCDGNPVLEQTELSGFPEDPSTPLE